jgi:putative transposase
MPEWQESAWAGRSSGRELIPFVACVATESNFRYTQRLLSDNGCSYIAGDLAEWLGNRSIKHIRGAPFHPQTQGKIERWHQTLKNRILLENYYLPAISKPRSTPSSITTTTSVTIEATGNLTPADVYFGRGNTIPLKRERIKRQTTPTPDAWCTPE